MGNELSQQLGMGRGAVPDCCEARNEDQTVMHAVRSSFLASKPPAHIHKKGSE